MNYLKNKTFRLIVKSAISKTGENAVLLDLESGIYFELNDVALLIVENLKEYTSLNEIKRIVSNNFEILESESEKDIITFLQELFERDFLEIK
tara:strand:- start:869 stop:1147 length:279 start_codon:yes stop_codon:yes gene_type:complete